MADQLLDVEIVAAERRIWEGKSTNVIARTTEGDVGILPGHEPFLALLVPCAAEVVSADGRREVFAVDGGFISVAQNRVSVIAQDISLAEEVSLDDAYREMNRLHTIIDEGEADDNVWHRYRLASAQVKAAKKYGDNK